MFTARSVTTSWAYALAAFRLRDDRICDLDDPRALMERDLRPSRIVTRDREITQRWARDIHSEGRWIGVSWWSFYDPAWASMGLWEHDSLAVTEHPEPLTADHPAVRAATEILNKPWR